MSTNRELYGATNNRALYSASTGRALYSGVQQTYSLYLTTGGTTGYCYAVYITGGFGFNTGQFAYKYTIGPTGGTITYYHDSRVTIQGVATITLTGGVYHLALTVTSYLDGVEVAHTSVTATGGSSIKGTYTIDAGGEYHGWSKSTSTAFINWQSGNDGHFVID